MPSPFTAPELARLLSLPTGGELDAAVAEHVMGCQVRQDAQVGSVCFCLRVAGVIQLAARLAEAGRLQYCVGNVQPLTDMEAREWG